MELTLDQALERGIDAHKAGQVQEADRLYTAILKAQPKHPDANHNMGVLAVGVGKVQKALPFFKIALEKNPSIAQYWLSYIDALIKLDRLEDAKAVLDHAKEIGAKGKAFDKLEQQLEGIEPTKTAGSQNQDPPQEELQSLIRLHSQNRHQEAFNQTKLLLNTFPSSALLHNICGMTNIQLKQFDDAIASFEISLKIKPDCADAYSNMGNALKEKGDLKDAISCYERAIKLKPDYAKAYNNLGTTLKDVGNFEAAINNFQKAIEADPKFAQAYINLGDALQGQNKSDEAIKSYERAISIKHDAHAYNNLGNALKDKGNYEAAIKSFQAAIKLKPDFPQCFFNLGVIFQEQAKPEAALKNYVKALSLNPDYMNAKANLITLLTYYSVQNKTTNSIVLANEKIRKINFKGIGSKNISDAWIVNLYKDCVSIIDQFSLDLSTEFSQTYRHNGVDLNCHRHMSISKKNNIIPEFCFGCYKVQVEPRTIIELIKLLVIFDRIDLEENNIRKCMVEVRPNVSGFYKGFIYCSNLKQANQISTIINNKINKSIGLGLYSKVKRGCSEYPLSFPDYEDINHFGPQLMNYQNAWKKIEANYDRQNPSQQKTSLIPSLSGLNLQDFLIIQKWLDYAKGIGDSHAELLTSDSIKDQELFNIAQARLNKFVLTS